MKKPLPNPPQGAGEAGAVGTCRVAEYRRLVIRVRRFRVISCRDAASVLSKCAEWFSVTSVSSVFKIKIEMEAPPQPSPRGG